MCYSFEWIREKMMAITTIATVIIIAIIIIIFVQCFAKFTHKIDLFQPLKLSREGLDLRQVGQTLLLLLLMINEVCTTIM